MGLVTATESRTGTRDLYVPTHERGMVHRSYLSPDRKQVLLVEMENGGWLPCRVIPFDGSSTGRQVGPPGAACTNGAWSPDGEWVYLSSNTGGRFHIWRQRVAGGEPEQITSGPTEEEGIAMAPDGRSLVTSVGTDQSALWVHDSRGDREVSSEGYSFLTADRHDVLAGRAEALLPGSPRDIARHVWGGGSVGGGPQRRPQRGCSARVSPLPTTRSLLMASESGLWPLTRRERRVFGRLLSTAALLRGSWLPPSRRLIQFSTARATCSSQRRRARSTTSIALKRMEQDCRRQFQIPLSFSAELPRTQSGWWLLPHTPEKKRRPWSWHIRLIAETLYSCVIGVRCAGGLTGSSFTCRS